ncbi:MAG TPA: hypothetical protein DCM08_09170 [Microscillaceae bacterium]|jgi:hypothetical protein|nr:hypothetical protein [Microscillaceae bacterium]
MKHLRYLLDYGAALVNYVVNIFVAIFHETPFAVKSLFFLVGFVLTASNSSGSKNQIALLCKNLKLKPIHLGYEAGFYTQRKTLENVVLPPNYTLEGKLVRTLRYENIAKAVERRYCLPEHIILAMIMQETMGEECLPNRSKYNKWGDGGFGLCHTQGITAEEYGLNTVCNSSCGEAESKYVCYKHAKTLGEAITYRDNCDMTKMHRRDDRLHPILNLDMVGRMMSRKKGSVREKVQHFRGGSYEQRAQYWTRVKEYWNALNNDRTLEKAEEAFNKLNKAMLINGKKPKNPFEAYIKYYADENMNYGLWKYAAMGACENCCSN